MVFKLIVHGAWLILLCICVGKGQDSTVTTASAVTSASSYVQELLPDDDKEHTLTSENFPQPYPAENRSYIIKVNTGYFVVVKIESLDLNSNSGDFLVIKSGSTLEDNNEGRVFTYILKEPRKYFVHSNNVYIHFQVEGNNAAGKKGFSLKYQRVGEEITTISENPTTEVTWPTPSGSDSVYFTAYLSGKTQEDFSSSKILNHLKTALAEMATEYCMINNILLKDTITIRNVQMYRLIQCPYNWPNSETCVKFRFALPVLLHENSSINGYQLNSNHLEQMWNRLANSYLAEYGMSVYSTPNNSSSLKMWIVISCIILILFLILLYFVKMVGHHFSPWHIKKRRMSDTNGIIASESRICKLSLGPHPLQTTPPFFDNDYSYTEHEPDVGIPRGTYDSAARTDYPYPLSEEDSDNDIIFNNFSNSRNNIVEKEHESNS